MDPMETVRQVRVAKAVLGTSMSADELAAALGVAAITMRQYASRPGTPSHRPIPAARLATLLAMAAEMMEEAA